ncbi:hypothetical protein C8N25_10588 [Algoriphagus antarcticus]|uniref:Uncharacterized protein n=1 Tax=Algoriphagus antarcticus TaxID=238540 RepID=A0A3E0E025_9BACT|nr:hypothetical protein C8N25_10588 [Algoriphagus antarcticus]
MTVRNVARMVLKSMVEVQFRLIPLPIAFGTKGAWGVFSCENRN